MMTVDGGTGRLIKRLSRRLLTVLEAFRKSTNEAAGDMQIVDVPGALDNFPLFFTVNRLSVVLFLISVCFRWLKKLRIIYEVPFQEFCYRCLTSFQTFDLYKYKQDTILALCSLLVIFFIYLKSFRFIFKYISQ